MTNDRRDTNETTLATLRDEIARTIRRVCPSAVAAQAEDLAHDILLKLIEKGEGDPARQASYWRKAAYHAVVDEIRRRRRRREDPLDDALPRGGPAAASAHDPERRAASREIGEAIGECVRRLRTTRRLAVVLFLQGHSLHESAALLGWADKRVESGLYRGLQDLRGCLARKGWKR